MPKFAHFEDISASRIHHVYTRHAEVARDIHQQAAREFSGQDITVDLVSENALNPSPETLEKMSNYSSISVSSGFSAIGQHTSDNVTQNITNVIDASEGPMPIYTSSAGNSGRAGFTQNTRMTDFMRNGITVGEANTTDPNAPHIEEHSSPGAVLSSANPFDTGNSYHYVNMSPSLEGHEELIKDYLRAKEVQKTLPDDFNELSSKEQAQAFKNAQDAIKNDPEIAAWIDNDTQDILANPEAFHKTIISEISEDLDFDENGYATGIDGTSFSGPYVAGTISGAIAIQEQRAEQGLPALTQDEIATLAKLATTPVTAREGQEDPMRSSTNDAGQNYSTHGGHGIFTADKFKALMEEAHQKIETDPDIDRTSVNIEIEGQITPGNQIIFDMPADATPIILDRSNTTIETELGRGINGMTVQHGDSPPKVTRVNTLINDDNTNMQSWKTSDREFGETIPEGQSWTVKMIGPQPSQDTISAKMRLHGYEEDSLMGGMIKEHNDIPEQDPAPDPKSDFGNSASEEPTSTNKAEPSTPQSASTAPTAQEPPPQEQQAAAPPPAAP